MYGRQLARVHAPQYHETLLSQVYPGNQEGHPVYGPVIAAIATQLGWDAAAKARTILRADAGFGRDANMNQALGAGWQIMAKAQGGRRPTAVARQVPADAWVEVRPQERWLAPVPAPVTLVRPLQWVAVRWRTATGDLKHALVVRSLMDWTPEQIVAAYDDRGACETEIQADKAGLRLTRRRKKVLAAQEALILLTDVAHNLLAWLGPWLFPSGPLAQFGPTRLIEDVLAIPGCLQLVDTQLVRVQLQATHPHAAAVAAGLERLLDHFGFAAITEATGI